VSNVQIRNGRVIFTTLLPSTNPCEFGGSGWLMELDTASGARLDSSVFDLNGDKNFGTLDEVVATFDVNGDGQIDSKDKVPTSGKKSKVGIIPQPAILSSVGSEYKYTSGSTGSIETTTENPGPGEIGRQSWRQLQ